jgi:hypothetical protein
MDTKLYLTIRVDPEANYARVDLFLTHWVDGNEILTVDLVRESMQAQALTDKVPVETWTLATLLNVAHFIESDLMRRITDGQVNLMPALLEQQRHFQDGC